MSFRLRLLLGLLAIYCAGGYYLVSQMLEQVRPRYLESMEESLVDISVLLASVVETNGTEGALDVSRLAAAAAAAQRRGFEARIFSLRKTEIDLRIYVVDANGRVIFDSSGENLGADFSQWRDVALSLRGAYGARSTRDEEGNDHTQVLYVAAPIRHDGRIVGSLTVGKPTRGINELVAVARQKLLSGALVGGVGLLAVLMFVASWVSAPLERLTAYAREVRDGRKAKRPRLPGRTLRDLGVAFEEMRDALEGRQYVERYTQALAHEVKAPLAAIRGAAELIDEEMPVEQRKKFVANIRRESARIQQSVERLLELSSLEARKELARTESIDVAELMREASEVIRPALAAAGVELAETFPEGAVAIRGERVLLREAFVNLLQNASDFSPAGTTVRFAGRVEEGRMVFVVEDSGPGVPDYAVARVFERFYSLPRPGGARKSTGLGLTLVREIAHLHGGEARLENRPEGGARATVWVKI